MEWEDLEIQADIIIFNIKNTSGLYPTEVEKVLSDYEFIRLMGIIHDSGNVDDDLSYTTNKDNLEILKILEEDKIIHGSFIFECKGNIKFSLLNQVKDVMVELKNTKHYNNRQWSSISSIKSINNKVINTSSKKLIVCRIDFDSMMGKRKKEFAESILFIPVNSEIDQRMLDILTIKFQEIAGIELIMTIKKNLNDKFTCNLINQDFVVLKNLLERSVKAFCSNGLVFSIPNLDKKKIKRCATLLESIDIIGPINDLKITHFEYHPLSGRGIMATFS